MIICNGSVQKPVLYLGNKLQVAFPTSKACSICSADGLADCDPGVFASLAGQLGVLPQLSLLSKQSWTGPVAECITQTLLNLACSLIAAFDLSPFTLPSDQLQALLELVVNLYEGEYLLICSCFGATEALRNVCHALLARNSKKVCTAVCGVIFSIDVSCDHFVLVLECVNRTLFAKLTCALHAVVLAA